MEKLEQPRFSSGTPVLLSGMGGRALEEHPATCTEPDQSIRLGDAAGLGKTQERPAKAERAKLPEMRFRFRYTSELANAKESSCDIPHLSMMDIYSNQLERTAWTRKETKRGSKKTYPGFGQFV